METDLDEYMPQKHPAFVYSNQAEDLFDIEDGIIIAIENQEGIYNSRTLQKVRDLTRELQKLEEIEKDDVNSLFTAENIIGTDDGLEVRAFYKKVPQSQQELKAMGSRVRENEMVFKRIVSADEKSTLIIARIGDEVFSQEFYHRILGIVEAYEGPERVYVAGRPIVEGTMAYLGPRDMKRMAPLVLLVIFVVLLIVLRSIKNTLLTLSVVILSIIWSFGLMATLNIPIYAVSTMIPVMLIAIGVADGIHLMGHLEFFIRENPRASKKDAVADMLNVMWKPVVMTSVTTMVGFSSLVTSRVYPVKYFGLFTAFGVGVALAMSLILIPAGIMIAGLPNLKKGSKKNTPKNDGQLAHRFSEILTKRPYITIAAAVIIVGTSIFGIGKVWINSSFIDNFEKESDIVQTDAFINRNFGGTSTLNVIVEGKNENTMKRPAILRILDQMQSEVESLDMVGTSFGLTDYLKRMNKVMHADNPAYDEIPDSQELIAQYLLLYEMSGDPENLWRVVDYNYRNGNITLQLKSDDSRTIKSAISVIEPYLEDLRQQGVDVHYAGSGYKGLVFTDLILKGQISSLLLALGIVIILIALMFKKTVVGLIGSLPIVITAIINFGIMGLIRVPLGMTTALVSSIAIGVGVDYAIHFIERYREYARSTGDKVLTGALTMHHTGRAILFNAVVVIAGFLVLLFSAFPPNRTLGALVSLNMFTSFFGTVTIMFLLLFLTDTYFKKDKRSIQEVRHES
jgi:predicted RND superfamily exporter protein